MLLAHVFWGSEKMAAVCLLSVGMGNLMGYGLVEMISLKSLASHLGAWEMKC